MDFRDDEQLWFAVQHVDAHALSEPCRLAGPERDDAPRWLNSHTGYPSKRAGPWLTTDCAIEPVGHEDEPLR